MATIGESLPSALLAHIRANSPIERQSFLDWSASSGVGVPCLILARRMVRLTAKLDAAVIDCEPIYEAVAHQMRIYAYS